MVDDDFTNSFMNFFFHVNSLTEQDFPENNFITITSLKKDNSMKNVTTCVYKLLIHAKIYEIF